MNLLPPPGPQRTRQLSTLAVVVAVLALVGWYFYGGDASTPAPAATATTASNAQAAAGGTRGGALALPAPLKLDALDPDGAEAPSGTSRNPFRFGEPPKPPAPAYVPPPPASMMTAPPPPPGPPPVPPIPLTLQGLVTLNDGTRVATLKDPASERIFQGVEGQSIDGRYRLVKIGLESVVMSYLDGSGMRTISRSQ